MKKIKVLIDIFMFIATILIIDIKITGLLLHEVLGITLALLFLAHISLNFKWIKQITKNIKKVNIRTKILYIVDILTFIIYFTTIVLGTCISAKLFNFGLFSAETLLLHNILGRLSAIIMLVHLGFHLNLIINKFTKDKTTRGGVYIIYIGLSAMLAMYLIFTLVNSYVWQGMM